MNKVSPTSPVHTRKALLPEPRSRISPTAVIVLLAVALGLMIGYRFLKPSVTSTPTASASAIADKNISNEPAPVTGEQPEAPPAVREVSLRQARAAARSNSNQSSAEATSALPASSAAAQQLIAQLAQVDVSRGALNPEQVKQLKQNLAQVTAQGAAAVPAIREFLEKNQDLSFGDANAKAVGYGSMRTGLIDALRQIGGPEAIDVSLGALQTAAEPAEIAMLARNLEEMAPGQYRQEALNATRDALTQIASGDLKASEVGPLFQLLQTYGDTSVIPDLEKNAAKWSYYATMALAGLPSGEGIPSLIHMVQEPGASLELRNSFGLQMLAQVSAQYPEAASALLDQARANQIPEMAWSKIATGLAGDQYQFVRNLADNTLPLDNVSGLKTYHVQNGNQNFYSTPVTVNWPADQINQRSAVIDQILALNPSPTAVQALQNARAQLSRPRP